MNHVIRWNVTVPLPLQGGVLVPLDVNRAGTAMTLITFPLPYVIAMTDERNFTDIDEVMEGAWEAGRRRLAACANLPTSAAVPKIGIVTSDVTGEADLRFRSRLGHQEGWHPGAPGSGLLALGAALLHPGTTPHQLARSNGPLWVVSTPAGKRSVRAVIGPDGSLGIQVEVAVAVGGTRP